MLNYMLIISFQSRYLEISRVFCKKIVEETESTSEKTVADLVSYVKI